MSFTLKETPDGVDLVVSGRIDDTVRDAVRSGLADGLVLNRALGFAESSVEGVRGLPLRRIQIIDHLLEDLAPLYSLSDELTSMQLSVNPRAIINLKDFRRLEALAGEWHQIATTVSSLSTLTELFVLHYAERDLSPLAQLTGLRRLKFKDYPMLTEVAGVDAFAQLEFLGIYLARKLATLDNLASRASEKLTTLELPACPQIESIAALGELNSLRNLNLSDCGDIETLTPIRQLVNLERLYLHGSTRVADNDLEPIASLDNLRDFRMMNRRSYRPSVPSIQTAIANR